MAVKNQVWWRKYRPKTLNSMVLLPRIKKIVENGIQKDIIFHGHHGTGKSTLIEILLKDKNFLKINASDEAGIDTLRNKITDFCTSMASPFVRSDDKIKYVYLEEFDRATPAFQDAFKAFIEQYDERVRFIISMNDVSRVIGPLQSRFSPLINFNPANDAEKNFLMSGYLKYLTSISKHNKMEIPEEHLKEIVSKNFPDLRACVGELHLIYLTGGNEEAAGLDNYSEIFNFIMNGDNDFHDNFYYVMDNWVNQPKDLIDILSRPFYHYLFQNFPDLISKIGFDLLALTQKYNAEFEMTTDPPLHVFSLICEIKKLLK